MIPFKIVFYYMKYKAKMEGVMKKYDSDCKVITNGWSGMNSTQLRSYLSELVEVDDDVVLLMIGTNNRKLFNEMEILFHDLVAIINQLKNIIKKFFALCSQQNPFLHTESGNNLEVEPKSMQSPPLKRHENKSSK